ncbi:formimidoylglutamase [Halobacillus salinarum]|uniref:Formimidoylglutamase n=1 Tax=Halobacillus salinarum TaxID=2932257 RepID=A0ABY4EPT0_9BACI|nr:formimidoylglutamase [Halobacillus salinarum]UOQ45644.1 formimidoylglutamase [Halobacillus salinarum]
MSFQYLKPAGSTLFKDRYTQKVDENLQPYDQGIKGEVGIIGLPSSKSSISLSMAQEAPKTIRKALGAFSTYSLEKDEDYKDMKIIDFGDVAVHPTSIEETLHRLNTSVTEMLETKACEKHVVIGGDHGISYPSIEAFHNKFGRIGVIQWDAHHDVRNLKDGGRTNGTPFRSLLEEGILNGEDLVQVGIRDFSNAKEYGDYAKKQGVHVYTMGDVEDKGLNSIITQEMDRLAKEVHLIYLSVDMDVVDQAFAPGCPAVGPGGLTSRELLSSISQAAKHPLVKTMDIVEVDPSKDVRDITSRLAAHVMMRFMFQ